MNLLGELVPFPYPSRPYLLSASVFGITEKKAESMYAADRSSKFAEIKAKKKADSFERVYPNAVNCAEPFHASMYINQGEPMILINHETLCKKCTFCQHNQRNSKRSALENYLLCRLTGEPQRSSGVIDNVNPRRGTGMQPLPRSSQAPQSRSTTPYPPSQQLPVEKKRKSLFSYNNKNRQAQEQ